MVHAERALGLEQDRITLLQGSLPQRTSLSSPKVTRVCPSTRLPFSHGWDANPYIRSQVISATLFGTCIVHMSNFMQVRVRAHEGVVTQCGARVRGPQAAGDDGALEPTPDLSPASYADGREGSVDEGSGLSASRATSPVRCFAALSSRPLSLTLRVSSVESPFSIHPLFSVFLCACVCTLWVCVYVWDRRLIAPGTWMHDWQRCSKGSYSHCYRVAHQPHPTQGRKGRACVRPLQACCSCVAILPSLVVLPPPPRSLASRNTLATMTALSLSRTHHHLASPRHTLL